MTPEPTEGRPSSSEIEDAVRVCGAWLDQPHRWVADRLGLERRHLQVLISAATPDEPAPTPKRCPATHANDVAWCELPLGHAGSHRMTEADR